MHILIVEDSPSHAKITCSNLTQRGLQVDVAGSLKEALAIIGHPDIDAILLDLFLPDSHGLDTFYAIQKLSMGKPIVIYTVEHDEKMALEAVRNGAQDFIVKGTASDGSLVRCLLHSIERSNFQRELRQEQRRMEVILDNSHDAFIAMDVSWHITHWNAQAERTFGWTRGEAIGNSFDSFFPPHLRKQYLQTLDETFKSAKSGDGTAQTEFFAIHRNGHLFPIEISVSRILEDPSYAFCAFVRDVTDVKQSKEELEQLIQERTERLTESNEELRQFAKIASHDLQEPLRAVEGFANLLAERTKGQLDQDAIEFIEYILDGTKRMQLLIHDVLAHSQIHGPESHTIVTDCNSVIEEVLSNLDSAIERSGATIEVLKLPKVAVERSLMVQLFQNLINNAIKYRSANPLNISIAAEKAGDQWLFSVSDTSIGIEPQYAEKIFDMFARLHGKTQYPGAGIGLAICKRIVTSHGGRIWVESQLRQGSVFLFTLPTIAKIRRRKMKDKLEILLVEDTPSDVRLTQEALKASDLNYKMEVVNDGVEALEYLQALKASSDKNLPGIILLDLNMPRKNGHEVLAEIKADPVLKQIPVVLLTVSERDEDVLEALRLKMNFYIAKPVTAQKLSALIKQINELNAEHPDTSGADHTNEETHIRLVLAGNPHTAAVALSRLADDPNERIRSRVAENIHTPVEVLLKLAKDPIAEVRNSITENWSASPSVLELLARDSSADVRLGLAGNPRTPKYILEQLETDDNVHVADSAAKTLSASKTLTP